MLVLPSSSTVSGILIHADLSTLVVIANLVITISLKRVRNGQIYSQGALLLAESIGPEAFNDQVGRLEYLVGEKQPKRCVRMLSRRETDAYQNPKTGLAKTSSTA